jgi:hypothetical protein
MTIGIERILKIDPILFFEKMNPLGKQYRIEGVNTANEINTANEDRTIDVIGLFAKRVPEGAEWVIGYDVVVGGAGGGENSYDYGFMVIQTGLALIPVTEPKKDEPKKFD